MKKIIFILLIVISLTNYSEIFAGRKLQWQKFINDTTRSFSYGDWRIEGSAIDTNNNIYVAYNRNGNDTTMTVISKLSASGELLWRTTMVPHSLNQKVVTRIAWRTLLYLDQSQNLVLVNAGFDTSTRFIALSKWTTDGVLIDQVFTPSLNYELDDVYVNETGEIYTIDHVGSSDSAYVHVKGFSKNFDIIYSDTLPMSFNGNFHLGDSWLCVAAKDSFVSVAYTIYNTQTHINSFFLNQKNKYTGDTSWLYSRISGQSISDLTYQFDELYLIGNNGLEKFSVNTGVIIDSEQSYGINKCIFDTLSNRIYCLSGIAGYNYKMFIFDKDLNYINEFTSTYIVTNFSKTDEIITLTRSSDAQYQNLIFTTRIDTSCALVDNFIFTLPPLLKSAYPCISLIDKHKDLILCAQTWSTQIFDTSVNKNLYSAPILIQKICYNCVEDLKGKVFFDTQNNCTYDSTCSIVEGNFIHLMPENIYTTTDSLGNYSFVKPSGIATITYIPKFNFAYVCDSSSYTINMANGYNDTLDFGLRIKEHVYDISTTITSGTARPGFQQYSIISAENLGTQKAYNKMLHLKTDSIFTFLSSTITPDSTSGNSFFWFIDSLNPGAIKSITVLNLVDNHTLGYQYKHTANITTQGDMNPSNNTDTTKGTVIGSFDPNYKAANPVGSGPQHFIENNTLINYYVEFQNTGTDTAFNIKIVDVLDNDLDISTLKVKGASHPMHYKLQNRQLEFYFENILLVDSNKDYNKSIGFLTFSIMPKKCVDGTLITNNAAIYFDFNEPVITNTTLHTIGRPGSLFDNENLNDFNFFPNPVTDQSFLVTVNMATNEGYSLVLTDITGKQIYQTSSANVKTGKYQHNISLSGQLSSGVYFLTLKTGKNDVTKKVILAN